MELRSESLYFNGKPSKPSKSFEDSTDRTQKGNKSHEECWLDFLLNAHSTGFNRMVRLMKL